MLVNWSDNVTKKENVEYCLPGFYPCVLGQHERMPEMQEKLTHTPGKSENGGTKEKV